MKKGFYPALGTPLEMDGTFCADSMTTQIEQQIGAEASGLLVMGSMGNSPYIRDSEYKKVAQCSVKAAKGQVPVLVGVTDVSIVRVMDRVQALSDIDGIDGVVSTVPYYAAVTQEEIYNFYWALADRSKFPVYLYDLPGVTKVATDAQTVKRLWKHPNIRGIKSGSFMTHRILKRSEDRPEGFSQFYSDLELFDAAYQYGIDCNLDGMFACTPKTARDMYRALAAGDMSTAGDKLDEILALRVLFMETNGLMQAFSHAMNLLGCPGYFAKDYQTDISQEKKELVTDFMKKLGEI
ncbi:MAG: dihydrodipicolinate synthase family protein [Lachnospiraceae bacterium]|nr:dihydrodipicolinate synthase family protein [Lachnospiraceae bacterium]MCI8994913.1 dihydrodipicolinate synthase family protein [Lachnospiraceae bacterium]MCI9133399.1 dihydrodipicolinate synthase family protein [Lachnospiraceae bacterium]